LLFLGALLSSGWGQEVVVSDGDSGEKINLEDWSGPITQDATPGGTYRELTDEDLEVLSSAVGRNGYMLGFGEIGEVSNGDIGKYYDIGSELAQREFGNMLGELVRSCINAGSPLREGVQSKGLTPGERMLFRLKY